MIMGSSERSKKKVQLWKKAAVHFALCFVMGFFIGFAPTGKSSVLSPRSKEVSIVVPEQPPASLESNRTLVSEIPKISNTSFVETSEDEEEGVSESESPESEMEPAVLTTPQKLLIIITALPTTEEDWDRYQGLIMLGKMANTMRLVPQPMLWVVVEKRTESDEVSEMLRRTGIMYRHVVYKENFTDTDAETDHQRNVALRHIKEHSLSGIVHFAPLSNIYDLGFFDELREIEVFGTWPVAVVSAHSKKVDIEGPVCDSSQLLGWHLREMNNDTGARQRPSPPIQDSSIAFNSSVLWDPERWGRPSSSQATPDQDSIRFVKEIVEEDEANVKGIPGEKCTKVMVWHLSRPSPTSQPRVDENTTSSDPDDDGIVRRDK
ncbi:hypothetical protein MLD38_035680 [Melastoma candidum]|uniref:Uncharacterized protein n=1 Tax=Melastoma candidum TaxID=119954 RepID=A0ACB9LHB3_9MYRT|nr:hypothetical protein MLD38_035680 [Melastoma candidum]